MSFQNPLQGVPSVSSVLGWNWPPRRLRLEVSGREIRWGPVDIRRGWPREWASPGSNCLVPGTRNGLIFIGRDRRCGGQGKGGNARDQIRRIKLPKHSSSECISGTKELQFNLIYPSWPIFSSLAKKFDNFKVSLLTVSGLFSSSNNVIGVFTLVCL